MRTDAGRLSPAGIIAVVGVVAILSGVVFTHLVAAPTSQFPTGTAVGEGSGGAVYTAPQAVTGADQLYQRIKPSLTIR